MEFVFPVANENCEEFVENLNALLPLFQKTRDNEQILWKCEHPWEEPQKQFKNAMKFALCFGVECEDFSCDHNDWRGEENIFITFNIQNRQIDCFFRWDKKTNERTIEVTL